MGAVWGPVWAGAGGGARTVRRARAPVIRAFTIPPFAREPGGGWGVPGREARSRADAACPDAGLYARERRRVPENSWVDPVRLAARAGWLASTMKRYADNCSFARKDQSWAGDWRAACGWVSCASDGVPDSGSA